MYQKERIDKITDILKVYGYVTVKFLTKELDYSTATVNRDLNLMEKQKLVKRTYGGVELIERKGVPLPFRYSFMKSTKNKMGIAAAAFVRDGDKVFIDGSTTGEYLGRHLIEKKNITVITNNMALAIFLSEHAVEVICLGGRVVEKPYMLNSDTTVENAVKYNADICFFSTAGITSRGMIGDTDLYKLLHSAMLKNSGKKYFMADHKKINIATPYNLVDLNEVDGIITDYVFEDEVKDLYKNTDFIEVG